MHIVGLGQVCSLEHAVSARAHIHTCVSTKDTERKRRKGTPRREKGKEEDKEDDGEGKGGGG